MDIKTAVSICAPAVSPRDVVPILKHLVCIDRDLIASDSVTTVRARVNYPDFTCDAERMLYAMGTAQGSSEARVKIADDRVSVTIGKFRCSMRSHDAATRATYPCAPRPAPGRIAQALHVSGLCEVLRALCDVISTDATKVWSTGVLFDGKRMLATNNVVLAVADVPTALPNCIVPKRSIEQLLRVRDLLPNEQVSMVVEGNLVHFFIGPDVTVSSVLIAGEWPHVETLLAACTPKTRMIAVPPSMVSAVEALTRFVPAGFAPVLRLSGARVATREADTQAEMDLDGDETTVREFRGETLALVLQHATEWDLEPFPNACAFRGPLLRGVFIGVRQ